MAKQMEVVRHRLASTAMVIPVIFPEQLIKIVLFVSFQGNLRCGFTVEVDYTGITQAVPVHSMEINVDYRDPHITPEA